MRWTETDKADPRCRRLADRHYSRIHPGHPMWTRPGYNFVLYYEDAKGAASFCWFRPKWEAGEERFDRLRALECTLFRNESAALSSELIIEAVHAVQTWARARDTAWPDGLVTCVNPDETRRGRSSHSEPGACFRHAGWEPTGRVTAAGIWLRCMNLEAPMPAPREPRGQLALLLGDRPRIEVGG